MADQNLINIAGEVANSAIAPDAAKAFESGFQKTYNVEIEKQQKINNRMKGYMDQLENNVNMVDLSDAQKAKVNEFLTNNKNQYAEAANQLARIKDPSAPEYAELRNKMNKIRTSFSNLANQVDGYKQAKIDFAKDYDKNLVSKANDINDLDFSSQVFTTGTDIEVSEDGELKFLNPESKEYVNYSGVKKPFLKNNDGAAKITKLAGSVTGAAIPLEGAYRSTIESQLKLILNEQGIEGIKSLAKDDMIAEGGLGEVPKELMQPGNEEQLKKFVVDSYMKGLEESAKFGYDWKEKQRGKTAKNNNSGGFSKALRDEVLLGSAEVDKALSFANIANGKPTSKDVVNRLNSIDPTRTGKYLNRNDAFQTWLTANEKEDTPGNRAAFREKYPTTQQIFISDSNGTQPLNVDIHDSKAMFDLYLRNTKLSAKAQNYFRKQYGIQTTGGGNSTAQFN